MSDFAEVSELNIAHSNPVDYTTAVVGGFDTSSLNFAGLLFLQQSFR